MSDAQEHAQDTPIAGAVRELMATRNVTAAQVAQRSGVRRHTLGYILNGKTLRPRPSTLTALARALAEDPFTREVDPTLMAENERVLAVAAGYAGPTAREKITHLELCLIYRLASRERARAWLELIDRLEALPADALRRIAPPADTDARSQGRSPDG